ncbi:ribonuclease Z, mitochondrial [Aplysia californica]|uniref:ribonuclease Z n=1 Tax=Aplysia californica TaxID=6500 RepID=A0ABM0JNC9_APLCA|nr:ribonuclease Z, mitochondrial [Aplysia californica]
MIKCNGTAMIKSHLQLQFEKLIKSVCCYYHNTGCLIRLHSTMGRRKGKAGKGAPHHKNSGNVEAAANARSRTQNPSGKSQVKTQKTHKAPSSINLVVLGTGGPGASRSLLVTSEFTRYMFNCGEGTQRLAAMSKGLRASAFAKLSGLENIFITHKSWENTGGLLGLAMTLEGQKNPETKVYTNRDTTQIPQDRGSSVMRLYGPEGVEKITLMAKKFSVHSNMRIMRCEGEFQDAGLTITPVIFYSDSSKDSEETPEPVAKRVRRNSSSTSEVISQDTAFAYICKAKPPLAKINIEKCYDAGVTIGPMVGQLQRGFSVTLEDGRIVYPSQVIDDIAVDRRPFLVVECPHESFLTSLMTSPQLQEFMTSSDPQSSFAVIVHMTPSEVYNSDEYQKWMKRFPSSIDHLVMNRDAAEVDLLRVREHQARLSLVGSDIFPLMPELTKMDDIDGVQALTESGVENGASTATSASSSESELGSLGQGRIIKACSGLVYVYRGKRRGYYIEADEFNCQAIQKPFLEIPEVTLELDKLGNSSSHESQSEDENGQSSVSSYPKVVFLGTGSSEPNRIRAQSCILVQLSKHTNVILDCGEDSYGQLYRFFGPKKASRVLRKVKAIFVSHMHADHHLGLFSLLKERKRAFDEKKLPHSSAIVMAPIQMRRWLRFYDQELEPVNHLFRFMHHQQGLAATDEMEVRTATADDVLRELSLTHYEPVEVEHCFNSYGVTFTHSNGFKLAYSGDTRPCDNLVTAGENCNLLIHEATHEDALMENAAVSKHSTFSEAMSVGAKMKAENIILTHFSQRYAHMVPFFNMDMPHNVGIAFDNMQVCPRTMKSLPKVIPALTAIFSDELQKLEIRNIKRTREQEAKQSVEER